jgi:hypothetical protein
MTLNFTRQRQIAHALLPKMIEHRWGRIVNMLARYITGAVIPVDGGLRRYQFLRGQFERAGDASDGPGGFPAGAELYDIGELMAAS